MLSRNFVSVETPNEHVAVLKLDRPEKKNALSIALRDEMTSALRELESDESTRVVVLASTSEAFSAGFDLDEFARCADEPELYTRIWASGDPFHEVLLKYPLPLVAAVGGIALGGGMDMAVLCDIRIASAAARFGHPEARFGDVVYAPLHDLVGGATARELCLTGRIIDAAEALRLGLVSEVVGPHALLSRTLEVAETIARAPRELVIRTKAKIIDRATIAFTSTLAM